MNYQDQLKSPKWQKKRLDILNLRGFKCEKCNCEENQLHVHHRFYLKNRKAWEYDNDVFQVLCYICHENEHKKEDSKIEQIIDKKWITFINYFELVYINDPSAFEYMCGLMHSMETRYDPNTLNIICKVLNSDNGHDLVNIAEKLYELDNLLFEKELNN